MPKRNMVLCQIIACLFFGLGIGLLTLGWQIKFLHSPRTWLELVGTLIVGAVAARSLVAAGQIWSLIPFLRGQTHG